MENVHVSLSDLHKGKTALPFYTVQHNGFTSLAWKDPGSRPAGRPPAASPVLDHRPPENRHVTQFRVGVVTTGYAIQRQSNTQLPSSSTYYKWPLAKKSMRPRMRMDIGAKRTGGAAAASRVRPAKNKITKYGR